MTLQEKLRCLNSNLVQSFPQAASQVQRGRFLGPNDALATLAPNAILNALKDYDIAQSGAYRDSYGPKELGQDAGGAVTKLLGF